MKDRSDLHLQQHKMHFNIGIGFFATAFFAMMIWALPRIFTDQSGTHEASIILILGGLYLGFFKKTGNFQSVIHKGLGLIFMIFGFFLPWIEGNDATFAWKKYDDFHLTEAMKNGKPVMIDFTSKWCRPCQTLDSQVFSKKRIVEAAARFVSLRADMTHMNPKMKALAERYSVFAFPTIIFIGSDGNEQTRLRLVGIEGARQFEKRLNAVK